MRGVFPYALLHYRSALFAGCGMALDGSEYPAHLLAFFQ
jgi:hypothetical protein